MIAKIYLDGSDRQIEQLKDLKQKGIKVIGILDNFKGLNEAMRIYLSSLGYVDLYKIKIKSAKRYARYDLRQFYDNINSFEKQKICWKETVLKVLDVKFEDLPEHCVLKDWRI